MYNVYFKKIFLSVSPDAYYIIDMIVISDDVTKVISSILIHFFKVDMTIETVAKRMRF